MARLSSDELAARLRFCMNAEDALPRVLQRRALFPTGAFSDQPLLDAFMHAVGSATALPPTHLQAKAALLLLDSHFVGYVHGGSTEAAELARARDAEVIRARWASDYRRATRRGRPSTGSLASDATGAGDSLGSDLAGAPSDGADGCAGAEDASSPTPSSTASVTSSIKAAAPCLTLLCVLSSAKLASPR